MCRTLMTRNAVIDYELVYSQENGTYGISARYGQNKTSNTNDTVFVDNIATDLHTAKDILEKIVGMCVLPGELSYIIQDLNAT